MSGLDKEDLVFGFLRRQNDDGRCPVASCTASVIAGEDDKFDSVANCWFLSRQILVAVLDRP